MNTQKPIEDEKEKKPDYGWINVTGYITGTYHFTHANAHGSTNLRYTPIFLYDENSSVSTQLNIEGKTTGLYRFEKATDNLLVCFKRIVGYYPWHKECFASANITKVDSTVICGTFKGDLKNDKGKSIHVSGSFKAPRDD